ncbi:hypothetical protein SDRG_06175 [Saprolegnia diclina VS20]|uniref:Uncharacterized protein n=1 Tax=Saprolegnia diclina (strain VS20) TaxID=1156394 RepID=T0QFL0_SAPDV|nr:hypothetical protein SDRG_06175 [Saprolegnia diclina VS20]EQC36739.1 hypothetical protein SDRG_06175 [Saprolegnia diclina VS20]|eukprot:XP_008610160.1 hypothetical protein SDRG_06175 [Saprolegnia diclina VS20]
MLPVIDGSVARLHPMLNRVRFLLWSLLTLNSLLDPLKTLYGYYSSADTSFNRFSPELTVENTFNNISSKVCSPNGPFLDCYFELPVYGTGSLAGATCRSYYPIDKAPTQHVGNFFGNCTLLSGERIDIPDGARFVSTQWSVQTSSVDRTCLEMLGEGDSFACDTMTTANGRVINYRVSQTETTKWCKEFGGFYILNVTSGIQEVLVANTSGAPAFTSIPLTVETPAFSISSLTGCSATLRVGGTASQITTSAWYGDTVSPWVARTTRTANGNVITLRDSLFHVSTSHLTDGDQNLIRLQYKDVFRLCILGIVIYFRVSSIYCPIWLAFRRQHQPFLAWIWQRHLGLVLHKRERHNLFILLLLSLEAVTSVEDIVVYCQYTVYTNGSSYGSLLLIYMSIMRIVWPCALLLLVSSRLVGAFFGPSKAFAVSENIFLLGAPVVWIYIPMYVTNRGMGLFQGYRWTGVVVHHYTNSIYNVYTNQLNSLSLYWRLFGVFTLVSPLVIFVLSAVWRCTTQTGSISAYLLSPVERRGAIRIECSLDVAPHLEAILRDSTFSVPPSIARQITRAKLPVTQRCEAGNLAADGLVCLVYGEFHVLGFVDWGLVFPIENMAGHVAVIDGNHAAFDPSVSILSLVEITACPKVLGITDLI